MKTITFFIIILLIFTGCDNKKNSTTISSYTDVSKFNIMGIHLGDTYEKIAPEILDPFLKVEENNIYKKPEYAFSHQTPPEVKVLNEYVKRKDTGFQMRDPYAKVLISFDNNHQVYSFRRTKDLSVIPDMNLIKQQILEKYGKPDKEMNTKLGINLCWGACVETKSHIMQANYDKSLLITYSEYEHSTTAQASITFKLYDPTLSGKYSEWKTKLREDYKKEIEKKEKDEASNLKLFK